MSKKNNEKEKAIVEQMIRLYCRKKEGNEQLCPKCKELLEYAKSRLDRCRFGNDKPTCKSCPIHCYRPEMRKRIKTIMRWSGPRMIIYYPLVAIKHFLVRGDLLLPASDSCGYVIRHGKDFTD